MPRPGEKRSKEPRNPRHFGVGPTAELSHRVSVATLARVVFVNPEDGDIALALEHKATLHTDEDELHVVAKAQPFGGAVRILNFDRLRALAGGFHFDSERSRSEQDFRIFIQPSEWEIVRDYCLQDFGHGEETDLESDPARELVEEFDDALGVELRPEQYKVKPAGTILENEPVRTKNVHAAGIGTVRIYRVFEVQIIDQALAQTMLTNSRNHSSQALRDLALENAWKGGRGRANAMLVVSMRRIRDAYMALSPDKRGEPLLFENTILDGNVPAVLEDIDVPKYRNIYD